MLLFLLLGGVAVDRFHRPRVMFLSDLGRGVLVATVAWLAYAGTLEVWQVLVASLVFGFVDAFFQPAYIATVPEVTPAEDLTSANALTSISMQAGRIVGPAIGAAIVALGGTALAFGLNALSFFIAALFLVPLLRLPRPSATAASERQSVVAELRAGFSLVRSIPWLWISILVLAFSNIGLSGPFSVAMPFLVSDTMQADVGTLGFLYAFFPVGYILGGLWIGRQARLHHRGRLAYTGSALAGIFLAAFALPLPLWALAVCALINGAALEVFGVIWTSTMQEMVPQNMLGRVASIDQVGSFALLPVGFAIAGWATDAIGPAAVFAIGGLSTALVSLAAMAHPAVRDLD